MQITLEILKQFATTTVEKITHDNFGVLSAYLRGSVALEEMPLFGGTTDIDLVIVHADSPAVPREILRLTEQVHLDIEHHESTRYRRGRELRVHPWLGPDLYNAQVLFDPQHYLDFALSSVRGMFLRPESVAARAGTLLEEARQHLMDLEVDLPADLNTALARYFRILHRIANGLALLVGEPLAERRFLRQYADRLELLGKVEMHAGFVGLLGGMQVDETQLRSVLPLWTQAMQALPAERCPLQLHPCRHRYYYAAFEVLVESERPKDVLWPLLTTWRLAAEHQPHLPAVVDGWTRLCALLGFSADALPERIQGLGIYLEQAEDVFREWKAREGL